jgi:hypothetical protein
MKWRARYLLFIIPLVAIFLIVRALKTEKTLNTGAANYTAIVSFQPVSLSLPSANSVGIWVNSASAVGFVSLEFDFDPTKVKLAKDITLTSTTLTTNIKVSLASEANTTGKVYITLGLDTDKIASAPTGMFQVASVTFDKVATGSNVATNVTFNTAGMQIVAMDQSIFTLTATPLALTINPVTPTPTPTSSSSPGDVNGDGFVNILDIGIMVDNYGKSPIPNPKADLNNDGSVDIIDIGIVVDHYQ